MLGTSFRSISREAYQGLIELVAEMRAEEPELYEGIEKNLINVIEQCNNVTAVIGKLKTIRLERRLTLEEVAARANITRQSLRLIENSPLANPQVHTLQRYALALGHELKIKVVQKKKRGNSVGEQKSSAKKGNCDEKPSCA